MTEPAFVLPYFDDLMLDRQRLLWAVATRRQLERWEPLVAAAIRDSFAGRETNAAGVWASATEHHFALIAARNLIRALELDPPSTVSIDPTMRAELIEGRDLHEHWVENMPIFNAMPRTAQPKYRSGKNFAARNPKRGPYDWEGWTNTQGPRLLPNVTADALHDVLDQVENEVLAGNATLSQFVPPRAPSPWLRDNGEWWPKPEAAAAS